MRKYVITRTDGGELVVEASGFQYAPDGSAHFYVESVFDNVWGFKSSKRYMSCSVRDWTTIVLYSAK